jgi:hypothetical protein
VKLKKKQHRKAKERKPEGIKNPINNRRRKGTRLHLSRHTTDLGSIPCFSLSLPEKRREARRHSDQRVSEREREPMHTEDRHCTTKCEGVKFWNDSSI